jgi:hypothetical protein
VKVILNVKKNSSLKEVLNTIITVSEGYTYFDANINAKA